MKQGTNPIPTGDGLPIGLNEKSLLLESQSSMDSGGASISAENFVATMTQTSPGAMVSLLPSTQQFQIPNLSFNKPQLLSRWTGCP